MRTFTAYVEFDPVTNTYCGIVPNVTGAHTQDDTLDELRKNLKEVLELCQEEGLLPDEDESYFVGVEHINI